MHNFSRKVSQRQRIRILNDKSTKSIPLFSDKELGAAKERQEIELAAQRATLQEQRNHIGILDTALTNAQQNIRRLEEELRKKQMCIERLNQLHGALQQSKDRKNMLDYENELAKEPNRSGSSTNSDTKWQMADKNQMLRYDNFPFKFLSSNT